jgi:cysteine synthase
MKAANILETIGRTPHIRINRLFGDSHEVWVKSERSNPGGSIKDRIALSAAIAQHLPKLAPGSTVLGFNYDTGERYLSIEGFLPA